MSGGEPLPESGIAATHDLRLHAGTQPQAQFLLKNF